MARCTLTALLLVFLATFVSAQFLPTNVLILDDADSLGAPVPAVGPAEQACINLGLPHTVTHGWGSFDGQLQLGGWDLVIVSHINLAGAAPTNGHLNRLNSHLTGGGRLIFGSWNLVRNGRTNHPLFASMGVDVVDSEIDLTGTANAYPWDPSDPMVAALPNPTQVDCTTVAFTVDAVPANAIPGSSVALMGWTAAEAIDQGLIIARNDRQAVYMGHFPQMMEPFLVTGTTLLTDVMACMSDPACRTPTCLINAPTGGAAVLGDVTVDFDGLLPSMVPVDLGFEFSLDGGSTWTLATAASGSPLANPSIAIPAPFAGQRFIWDSLDDGVGHVGTQPVVLRVTIDTGVIARDCSVSVSIDNRPISMIVAPTTGEMVAGEVPIDFGTTHSGGRSVDHFFQFSRNGGTTWVTMSAGASSLVLNPDLGRPTPVAARFIWDSFADGVGLLGTESIRIRLITTDTIRAGLTSSLELDVQVDNQPTCTVTAPAPGAMLAGDIPVSFSAADPAGSTLDSTFEFSLDSGASWSLATAAAGSPLANPDLGRPAPFSANFLWDSLADGVGLVGSQGVDFRITTINPGGGGSTCEVAMLVVANAPSCTMSSPLPGSTIAGEVPIVIDASDPAGDPVNSTFEVSVDSGATWFLATAAASSPVANPDPARPTPFSGLSFGWDSFADGIGLVGPQVIMLRVTVDDGVANSSCGAVVVCENQPSVDIAAPTAGSTVSANVAMTFNATDPSGLALTSSFELSVDGGATWSPATAAAGSSLANPDIGRPSPITAAVFIWDSLADATGMIAPQGVALRVSSHNGYASGSATVIVVVDNVAAAPTCSISAQAGTLTADIPLSVDLQSPSATAVNTLVEWSIDGGITFSPCTMAPTSPTSNPAVVVPTAVAAEFVWDSLSDGIGRAAPIIGVILRVTAADGVSPLQGRCTTLVDVDNTSLCQGLCGDCDENGAGPDVLDSLLAAQIAVSMVAPSASQQSCCDVDSSSSIDVLDALAMARDAAGLGQLLTCP